MTGTGGWAYFSATRYMLGIRPQLEELLIDPCIPGDWDGFSVQRQWRVATFNIQVENPNHVEKGVKEIYVDGVRASKILPGEAGKKYDIKVVMG